MQKLNECYHSPGDDKHSCCTHPTYCIFNPNRIRLEKNIHTIKSELQQRKKDLEFINSEGTPNSADYLQTKARIKYLNADLQHLRKHKNKIIKNKVKAYGHK